MRGEARSRLRCRSRTAWLLKTWLIDLFPGLDAFQSSTMSLRPPRFIRFPTCSTIPVRTPCRAVINIRNLLPHPRAISNSSVCSTSNRLSPPLRARRRGTAVMPSSLKQAAVLCDMAGVDRSPVRWVSHHPSTNRQRRRRDGAPRASLPVRHLRRSPTRREGVALVVSASKVAR